MRLLYITLTDAIKISYAIILVNRNRTLRDNFSLLFPYRVRYKRDMASQELTTTQAAQRLGVANVTVRLWCRQGRFPNARVLDTPRGAIWYIPEGDLKDFRPPQPGRPPKSSGNNTSAGRTPRELAEDRGSTTIKASNKGGKKGGKKA